MTLQDEMARTIRRAILAKPKGHSPALICAAQEFEISYQTWSELWKLWQTGPYEAGLWVRLYNARTRWDNSYKEFQTLLAEHADELQAICTENEP